MKRIISIIFTITILLTLCGCAPQAEPMPAPAPAPTLVPTPVPTPEPPEVYTIAWMSDTQHYSREFPETFYAMTEYLKEVREELNLKYIVHTGDIVASSTKAAQWQVAKKAMANIAHIPTGVCAGNHDVRNSKKDYSYYYEHFGESDCTYRICYGESYKDNRGHYDLVDIEGSRLMFLYMGYGVEQEGIEWMQEMLEKHPDRAVIVCTHAYFDTNLSLHDDGALIKSEIVDKYPNVYM
ncbi:MAG: metallophosphoesterase, partial [Clostridia bacterium]|nr:metallophosphoesterase [Clostridia bacterium]